MAASDNKSLVLSEGKMQVGKFVLTPVGLEVRGEPSFEEWREAGEVLRYMEGSTHWWLGDWLNLGEQSYGEMYLKAEAAIGDSLSYGTLRNCKSVAGKVELSRRRDNLSFAHHQEVAPLPPRDQTKWLKQAEDEGWTRAQLRAALRDERLRLTREENPFPEGKYRVLYADPPWEYSDTRAGLRGYTGAEDHYPTLKLEELCALEDGSGRKVAELTPENAVLFLWATCPLMVDALKVTSAWGFEYKSQFVWDKVKHNFGHYNSVRHELLLVCTRGSCTHARRQNTPGQRDRVRAL
jgi:hypothetical protein